MATKLVLSLIVTAALASFSPALAQTPVQERIVESIVINGQTAQGVLVVQNGGIQSYTCPSPESYVTPDRAESGWACFEPTTGMWLLHAQPPRQTAYAYPQASVYVPAPATTVYQYAPPYYAYPYSYYPYGYYPYSYYPYSGSGFGFGFGLAYRSPVFVNRTVVGRGPVVAGRAGVVTSRSFGTSRSVGGRAGVAGGRVGRR